MKFANTIYLEKNDLLLKLETNKNYSFLRCKVLNVKQFKDSKSNEEGERTTLQP
jgi:hypothetical protein